MKLTYLFLLVLFLPQALNALTTEEERAAYDRVLTEYKSLENDYKNLLTMSFGLGQRVNVLPNLCNGRLTGNTGAPVTISSIGSAATIYFTPFRGNQLSLYNGSSWLTYQFTELSLAGASFSASSVHDVFAYASSGAVAIEPSTAWTNTTTRADAVTLLNGVYVKNSDNTRRLIGTVYVNASNIFNDSSSARRIWNNCNRIPRYLAESSVTNTYSSASTTWVQMDSLSTALLVGIADTLVRYSFTLIAGSHASQADVSSGIGIASNTTNSALLMGGSANDTVPQVLISNYEGYPAVGQRAITGLGVIPAGTSTTFYGDNGLASANVNTYLSGWIEN